MSLPGMRGVTSFSQNPPFEEEVPFQNTLKTGKRLKYDHGFRRSPKPKVPALARTNINLLDWIKRQKFQRFLKHTRFRPMN
jgi:hypothetical protein